MLKLRTYDDLFPQNEFLAKEDSMVYFSRTLGLLYIEVCGTDQ